MRSFSVSVSVCRSGECTEAASQEHMLTVFTCREDPRQTCSRCGHLSMTSPSKWERWQCAKVLAVAKGTGSMLAFCVEIVFIVLLSQIPTFAKHIRKHRHGADQSTRHAFLFKAIFKLPIESLMRTRILRLWLVHVRPLRNDVTVRRSLADVGLQRW